MSLDFPSIVQHFRFDGEFLSVDSIETGHINDTYAARFRRQDGRLHRYLLQRINRSVFPSPAEVMSNIGAITTHMRRKVLAAGGHPGRETVNLVATVEGDNAYRTLEGDWWRAELFIEGAQTYETASSLNALNQVAGAFGRFMAMLSDFPASKLHETIPDFHHTPKRYEALVGAVARDPWHRAASVRAEIEFVEQRVDELPVLIDLREKGMLPVRVTHNDTKFNNVMIDDCTGVGICVVDLDTVMPGLSAYDFGDMVRSSISPAAEDEQDLSRVALDPTRFEALVVGYLGATREILTPLEIDCLPFSAKLMTLECGIRFLTDYLNGDVYFRTHRPGQNLDRCRTQFQLVTEMEKRFCHLLHLVEKHRYS
jgi:hypothetical protein